MSTNTAKADPTSQTQQRLKGRIALVTGASRGIGAAVAKQYAREGAHVILIARTTGGLEEVDDAIKSEGGVATLAPMDLKRGDIIDELGGIIAKRFGRLDIVVGNAAILGKLSPMGHIPPKVWEEVMAVNVTANWRLIRSVDALLRASDAGRAIFVTSGVTVRPYPYWGAYAASKAALEVMVKTYAAEVERTNLCVNLIDPGIVRTRMRAEAMPGEDPLTLPTPEDITENFVKMALPSFTQNGRILNR